MSITWASHMAGNYIVHPSPIVSQRYSQYSRQTVTRKKSSLLLDSGACRQNLCQNMYMSFQSVCVVGGGCLSGFNPFLKRKRYCSSSFERLGFWETMSHKTTFYISMFNIPLRPTSLNDRFVLQFRRSSMRGATVHVT